LSSDRKLTVILGAGASYDCVPPNTATVRPEFHPPLTKDLFSLRTSFDRILARYQKATGLSQDIRTRLSQGENLESILQEYASESSLTFKKQYWEVPLYLQEVLGEVSKHYVDPGGATSFATLVHEVERSDYDEVMYLTLNYDRFMEQAIEKVYGDRVDHMGAYTPRDKKWFLVKLHGSVNWGRRLRNPFEWVGNEAAMFDSFDSDLSWDKEIRMLSGHQQHDRYIDKDYYYPALAVPIEGKDNFVCPGPHVEKAGNFLEKCTDFLIIGFAALDQPVLELLGNVAEVRKLTIIDKNNVEGKKVLDKIIRANSRFSGYPADVLHSATFSDFMEHLHLRKFLRPRA